MSVKITNYYTISESIKKGLVDFSPRHLKRLINDQLKDDNNNLVLYKIIKGIKTIIIHFSILKKLKRRRTKSNNSKICTAVSKITNSNYSEITINFKNPFHKQFLVEIVKEYPSKKEFTFVVEGLNNNHHIHMMVQENTSTAKNKIESLLEFNKIDLKEVDLFIRPINNIEKFKKYISKYENLIKNYNNKDESNLITDGNNWYHSSYGTNNYNRKSIFDYKRKKQDTLLY